MDIDSAYPDLNNLLEAERVDLQNPIELRTGSTIAGELLAARLREHPPFGNIFLSLMFYFY